MKNIFLFLVLFIAAILAGCKKNGTSTPPPANVEKIKTITTNGGTFVIAYKFDATGRITIYKLQGNTRIVYLYTGNTVVQRNMNDLGTITDTAVYNINSNGLAVTYTNSLNPGLVTTYQFNSNRQLLKETVINGSNTSERTYYYSGGNLDSSRSVINGDWYVSLIYEYYNDQLSTLEFANSGYLFLGNGSKNSKKKSIEKYNTGLVRETVYTYELDAKNRINKAISVEDGGVPNESVYTYY